MELDMADRLSKEAGVELPDAIRALRDAVEVHPLTIEACGMEDALERILK